MMVSSSWIEVVHAHSNRQISSDDAPAGSPLDSGPGDASSRRKALAMATPGDTGTPVLISDPQAPVVTFSAIYRVIQNVSCAGGRQSFCGNHAAVRSTQERIKVIEDFLSKHINACRRIDADPHSIALDSKNGDGNAALGQDNPLTDLSTQHQHGGTSLHSHAP
jgi:hypothetical protein